MFHKIIFDVVMIISVDIVLKLIEASVFRCICHAYTFINNTLFDLNWRKESISV